MTFHDILCFIQLPNDQVIIDTKWTLVDGFPKMNTVDSGCYVDVDFKSNATRLVVVGGQL